MYCNLVWLVCRDLRDRCGNSQGAVADQKGLDKDAASKTFCLHYVLWMHTSTADLTYASRICRTVAQPLEVQWADSKGPDVDAANVKSLYISNLPEEVTETKLKDLLEPFGQIDRVALLHQKDEPTKMRDYAFIHYMKRSIALQVLEVLHQQHSDKLCFACQLPQLGT